jgi:hypothetical protein
VLIILLLLQYEFHTLELSWVRWHRFCSKSERCLLPLMENSATEHLQFILFHQLIMYIVGGRSIYLCSFVRCERSDYSILNCMMTIPSPQTSHSLPFHEIEHWRISTLISNVRLLHCDVRVRYHISMDVHMADCDESGARSQTTQAPLATDTVCAREHSLPLFMTWDNSWSATEQGSNRKEVFVVCRIYLLNR